MSFNRNIRHRKSIRLRGYDYSQPSTYFITICTHQRQQMFGNIVNDIMTLNAAGGLVHTMWRSLSEHYPCVTLGEHIVMPNHFHGILHVGAPLAAPHGETPTLGKILRRFKSMSAIAINRLLNRQEQPLWQRNYYEHIIRNESTYRNIAEYIRNNPQQWQNDPYR